MLSHDSGMGVRLLLLALMLIGLLLGLPLSSRVTMQSINAPQGKTPDADQYRAFVVYENERNEIVCRTASESEQKQIASRSGGGQTKLIYPGAPLRKEMPYGAETWTLGQKSNLTLLPSAGLRIVLHGTTELEQNQTAKNAFIVAANRWEAIVSTPITVVIDVDFGTSFFGQPYPGGVLGSTGLSTWMGAYSDVRLRLNNGQSTAAEQELYEALPATAVPVELNGATSQATSVTATLPNARALGLVPDIANPDSVALGQGDARIGFNSSSGFDFNPDDGITGGQIDFDSVASHEIGHALGFISESGGGTSSPLSIWDIFRFRPATASLGALDSAPRVMSLGGDQIFFNNRTSTFATQELALSTGGPNPGSSDGDGRQSSHWKDDALLPTRPYIGVMDPTLSRGLRRTISENDVNALDTLGYSIGGPAPVRPPNDDFNNAIPLQTDSGSVTGTNANGTREFSEPLHVGFLGDKSIWYYWSSSVDGVMTIDTIGSNFDTTLAVYGGSTLSQLITVAQNDDIVSGTNKVSRVDFDITAGVTYRIAVDGWNGEYGNITLNWSSSGSVPAPITRTQSVAYQIDPTHTGAQSDSITPPLAVRWSRDLGGSLSSPISYPLIAGGRVFVTAKGMLYALDAATGATLWGPVSIPGGTPGITYDRGRVFAVNFAGLLQAFDAVSGGLLWTKQLPQYSYFSPLTARGGLVYAEGSGSGTTVSGVSEQNGTIRWNASISSSSGGAPTVSSSGVYVADECAIDDFNPYVGTSIWSRIGCTGGGGRSGALFGGRLYARGFSSGNLILDENSGAQLGTFSSDRIPAFSGQTAYFLTGSTLEARDSVSLALKWSFAGDGTLSSAPIVDNGYVYIASESGKLYALSATSGTNVWTGTVGATVYPPNERNPQPLTGLGAADGLVIVPADNLLVAFQSAPTNPIDDARNFVHQHYLDFLNREPDQAGWDYWTSQLTQCGSDATCIRNKRIDISNAFFYELEYQQTGAYVYRLYRAAFGNTQPLANADADNAMLTDAQRTEARKLPKYSAFAADRAQVVGGTDLAQSQLALANAFVQRTEFVTKYPTTLSTAAAFVDALLANIGNDIVDQNGNHIDLSSQRQALIDLYNQGGAGNGGRGAVLYRLADDNTQTNPINNRSFIDAEYNRAFVFTQYAGYLRRDSDIAGYLFWLGQVNSHPIRDVAIQHAMVCSFITSAEYQLRFGSTVTHTNAECAQ